MRLVTFKSGAEEKLGLRVGDDVLDLSSADSSLPGTLVGLLAAGDDAMARVGELADSGGERLPYDDAFAMVSERVFDGQPLPPITNMVEDVDIASLDGNYVLPNMGLPLIRGIWFPVGYN